MSLGTAAEHWRKLVRARLRETERMAPEEGSAAGAAFWNARGRARRYQSAVAGTAQRDPLLTRIRRSAQRSSTVIDVGAGTGRFSLAIAPRVREVVALDPSRAMLAALTRDARARGITNVRTVESRWQDVDIHGPEAIPAGDIVVCSYVLPLIEDAGEFLAKMDSACSGQAFVYLNALSADALLDPLWRHFHGRRRAPAPTYLDAAAILRELGLSPQVEIVEVETMARFKDMGKAVKSYREILLLPDTKTVRAELREMLGSWLVDDRGELRPPLRTVPAAIVSWEGGATRCLRT